MSISPSSDFKNSDLWNDVTEKFNNAPAKAGESKYVIIYSDKSHEPMVQVTDSWLKAKAISATHSDSVQFKGKTIEEIQRQLTDSEDKLDQLFHKTHLMVGKDSEGDEKISRSKKGFEPLEETESESSSGDSGYEPLSDDDDILPKY